MTEEKISNILFDIRHNCIETEENYHLSKELRVLEEEINRQRTESYNLGLCHAKNLFETTIKHLDTLIKKNLEEQK